MNNKIKTSYIEDYKEHRIREFSLWESLLVVFGYILPFFIKSIIYSFLNFSSNTKTIIDLMFVLLPIIIALVFISINRFVALEQPIVQWFIVFYGLSLFWMFIPDFEYNEIIFAFIKLFTSLYLLVLDKDLVASFRKYKIVDNEKVVKSNFLVTSLIYIAAAIAAYFLFIILTIILSVLYKVLGTNDNPKNQESIETSFLNGSIWFKMASFISIVAIAPITEEFMLRRGIFHSFKNKWIGITLASFMFALLHVSSDIWLFFSYFTSSVVWSFTLMFFKSALPGTISHFMSNFIASFSLPW